MQVSVRNRRSPNDEDYFIIEGWKKKHLTEPLCGCWSFLPCHMGFIISILQTGNVTQKGCVPCASSHSGGRASI